jgi:general L-amino acid transport system permease protein
MALDASTGVTPARPPWWRDPATRALVIQAVLLVVVVGFGYWLFENTRANLERQGIASGFGFLERTAGFGIVMHLIPYSEASTYGTAFLVGLINTLVLSALAIVLATVIGFLVGIARLSSNWLVAKLAMIYVETLRNLPLLLQIFFWYFAVLRALPQPRNSIVISDGVFLNLRGLYVPEPVAEPGFGAVAWAALAALAGSFALARWARARRDATGRQFPTLWTSLALVIGLPLAVAATLGFPLTWSWPELKGFNFVGGLVLIPEFVAMIVALSLYSASFIAEIVRAGIQSVGRGQTEAAQALGLSQGQALRLVIVPQALRVIVPPLTSQYLNILKNSSLAAAIGYPEMVAVFAGTVLNQTGQAVEVIAITMAVYLTLSLLISGFMNWYNKRIALKER